MADPKIGKNVSLARYTTFKIGGLAQYFASVETKKELIEAIGFAKRKNLPFFILGAGSNVLVSDKGFKGLVIRNGLKKIKPTRFGLAADSGIMMSELLRCCQKRKLGGLEWATGLPGQLGGAICGNAGAYGGSMDSVIEEVCVLNLDDLSDKKFKTNECGFAYRDSVFKKKAKYFILSAKLKLKKNEYDKKQVEEIIKKRNENLPLNFPSAGCVFKNCHCSKKQADRFARKFNLPALFVERQVIPGAWLIDGCGLRGAKIGQARISKKHANFIVNLDQAKASDVLGLIALIKKSVKEKFGLDMIEEIRYVGF